MPDCIPLTMDQACCGPRLCENDYIAENLCKNLSCTSFCMEPKPDEKCDENGRSRSSLFREENIKKKEERERQQIQYAKEYPIMNFINNYFSLIILVVIILIIYIIYRYFKSSPTTIIPPNVIVPLETN